MVDYIISSIAIIMIISITLMSMLMPIITNHLMVEIVISIIEPSARSTSHCIEAIVQQISYRKNAGPDVIFISRSTQKIFGRLDIAICLRKKQIT